MHSGNAAAQRTPTAGLPPGVNIPQELPAALAVPPQVRIDEIDVDWTDPRLVASLEVGDGAGGGQWSWEAMGKDDPEALRIQLSVYDNQSGELTLPVFRTEARRREKNSREFVLEHIEPAKLRDRQHPNHAHVGGVAPWTFTGPGTAGLPGWNGDLSAGGAAVALRWLGTGDEWVLNPPEASFAERLLLSTLNPLSGQGRFFLIQNNTGRSLAISALTAWVREAVSGQHLIALHASGRHVEIGQGLWRLGGPGEYGGSTPAGAVLVLRKRAVGESENLARHHAVQATASSYNFAYPPSQVVSGRLWPVALRPPVWLSREASRTGQTGADASWIDLKLERTASVEEIRLIHLAAAGWSEHFLPGQLEISLRTEKDFESPEVFRIVPESSISVVRFPAARQILGVRVRFPEPTRFNTPSRAGLMAMQLYGQTGQERR
jgi:hypothetical protein